MDTEKLLQSIAELSALIRSLESKLETQKVESRSVDLKDLFTALAKAQGEMQIARKRSENPYFKNKYADLEEMVTASRPALSKYGLSVLQQTTNNSDGQSILHTILAHSSGQWISSEMKILPPKADVQTLGSYITYLKRYSYASLIGVVSSNEDDDGEIAVATERELFAKGAATNDYKSKNESYETVSKDQLDELEYELKDYADIAEEVLNKMQIQSLADMPKSKFRASIERIRAIKTLRNK